LINIVIFLIVGYIDGRKEEINDEEIIEDNLK